MSGTERKRELRFQEGPSFQPNTLREVLDDENFRRQEDERAMLAPTDNSQLPATDQSHREEDQLKNEDAPSDFYKRLEGYFLDRLREAEDEGYFIEIPKKNGWPRPWIAGRLYGRILYPVYEAVRFQLGLPWLEAKKVLALPDRSTIYNTTYTATAASFKHLQDTGKMPFSEDEETFSQQMQEMPAYLDYLQEGISQEFGLPYPPLYMPNKTKTSN